MSAGVEKMEIFCNVETRTEKFMKIIINECNS
jgi:hypothetical protein